MNIDKIEELKDKYGITFWPTYVYLTDHREGEYTVTLWNDGGDRKVWVKTNNLAEAVKTGTLVAKEFGVQLIQE